MTFRTRVGRLTSTVMIAAAASGCSYFEVESPAAGNACDQARIILNACGVTLPLLADDSCGGVPRAVAECVVERGDDCDALRSLNFDACLTDALERAAGPDGGDDGAGGGLGGGFGAAPATAGPTREEAR